MFTTFSTDGRVTFSLVPERDYSGEIMLPNRSKLVLPARDLLIMIDFYMARIKSIRMESDLQELMLPYDTSKLSKPPITAWRH